MSETMTTTTPWFRYATCVDCGAPKSGQGRRAARCKSCASKMPKNYKRAPVLDAHGMKTCTKCGVEKTADEFGIHKNRPDGRDTRCKACKNEMTAGYYQRWTPEQRQLHRARVIRSRYGVEMDLIHALYENQEGCCAICGDAGDEPGVHEQRRNHRTALVIDHDHQTGEIRGLLCDPCNNGLGRFRDSLGLLVKAAAYIGGGGCNGRHGRLFTG